MKTGLKKLFSTLLLTVLLYTTLFVLAFAAETTNFHLGQDSLVNTGTNNGYDSDSKKAKEINKNDPHWGWNLGGFYIGGFERSIAEEGKDPIFLKNVGDTVTLWFSLEQDIDCLNGDKKLSIAEDKDGWDVQLRVAQQNFGRGMLIIRSTDYENKTKTTLYTNFLEAKQVGANTQVDIFEEGDYEIVLDYEIDKAEIEIFGWKPIHSYYDYRMTFRFSVRNGNCMVFPFDVKTRTELTNASFTENGFKLDLAKSRYLDIDIKKENINGSGTALVEDTRFNRPAKDGNQYIDEGIYTITASNRYTGQKTTKVIYVGTNDVLKAHVVTGLPITEILVQIEEGATINKDGTITIPVKAVIEEPEPTATPEPEPEVSPIPEAAAPVMEMSVDEEKTETETETGEAIGIARLVMSIIGGIFLVALIVILLYRKIELLIKEERDLE